MSGWMEEERGSVVYSRNVESLLLYFHVISFEKKGHLVLEMRSFHPELVLLLFY